MSDFNLIVSLFIISLFIISLFLFCMINCIANWINLQKIFMQKLGIINYQMSFDLTSCFCRLLKLHFMYLLLLVFLLTRIWFKTGPSFSKRNVLSAKSICFWKLEWSSFRPVLINSFGRRMDSEPDQRNVTTATLQMRLKQRARWRNI